MRRRVPLSLPYAEPVFALCAAIGGEPVTLPNGDGASPAERAGRLVEAALHHNVAGYVLHAAANGRLELPAAEHHRLVKATAWRVGHSIRLRNELAGVMSALVEACELPPLLLKGPAVADRLYPQPGLRPFTDLDILVPRDELDNAARALESVGYEVLIEFRPGYAERFGHDRHAVRQVGAARLDVEVHWRVGDDPVGSVLSYERLAPRSEPLAVGGATVRATALPDQLLVLAMHLLSDREKRLCWVNDIALLAAAVDAEAWEEGFGRAEELGLSWVLHRALDYAHAYLGVARARPAPSRAPPRWGPMRAVEELDARAAPHFGRLIALGWRDRARFLHAVLWPTGAGLRGTVGFDAAPRWRLVLRHGRRALLGFVPAKR